jgi:hypothetical protein
VYHETGYEKMVQIGHELIEARGDTDFAEKEKKIISGIGSSSLSGIFNSQDARTFLLRLLVQGEHFTTMPEMRVKWWSKTMTNIHGGVRATTV